MKLVVNTTYGGFKVPKSVLAELGYPDDYSCYDRNIRGDLRLIKMVEENPKRFMDCGTKLRVVELPRGTTDYEVLDYDGKESVIYVLDGKIKYI